MLHIEDETIKKLLLKGKFGFELESHRITMDGHLAHTAHPFPGDPHISRDFSEDQIEINTSPYDTAEEAIDAMEGYMAQVQEALCRKDRQECLWPFSNPPYIKNERDIRIAQYYGEERENTTYREFLSDRYGRYLMTYSGIHVNYSFADELLARNAEIDGVPYDRAYKDRFYVDLAEKAAAYGWVLVALMAASPVMDSSFFQQGVYDGTDFCGMASPRCSELGYWNQFSPMFDYTDLDAYVDKIQSYVDEEMLVAARELYYPIRIKPAGKYSLEALREQGVDHIEFRMYDLHPFSPLGLNLRDVKFAQLFLVWLASFRIERMSGGMQVQAVQNFKNAAHYDLDAAKVTVPGCICENEICGMPKRFSGSVRETAICILESMRAFFGEFSIEVRDNVEYQMDKMTDESKRYAVQVRREYGEGFVRRGLGLAQKRQRQLLRKVSREAEGKERG